MENLLYKLGTFFVSSGIDVGVALIKVVKENAKTPTSRSKLPGIVDAGICETI